MNKGVVFGFVDSDVVEGLKTLGNWKARQPSFSHITDFAKIRQGAVDSLLATIKATDFTAGAKVEIPQFLEFLLSLIDDPNFKIKQCSLQTMALFIEKIGRDVEYYLRHNVSSSVI